MERWSMTGPTLCPAGMQSCCYAPLARMHNDFDHSTVPGASLPVQALQYKQHLSLCEDLSACKKAQHGQLQQCYLMLARQL